MFRLIIDPPLDGATNMARDEAMLTLHARGIAPPTLRLYQWSPACLSLGRFQRSGEIDRARCKAEGVQVVRRPSGGRALLHDAELTYAVVARQDSALGSGSIAASYRQISLGLLAGLARLGIAAHLTTDRQALERWNAGALERKATEERQQSNGTQRTTDNGQRTTAACYDSPAAYEAVVGGRKLIGSAQRRQNGALLQHGSIPFAPHADRLCVLLCRPPADLAARMVTIGEILRRDVLFEEVAGALVAGCAETWGVAFERGAWTSAELVLAEELRATTYADETWIWGR